MKRVCLYVVLALLINSVLTADDSHMIDEKNQSSDLTELSEQDEKVNSVLVKNFTLGEGPGELGFQKISIMKKTGIEIKINCSARNIYIFNDEIYILDSYYNRIHKYTLDGFYLETYSVSHDLNPMYAINFKVNSSFFSYSHYMNRQLIVINRDNNQFFTIGSDLQNRTVFEQGDYFLIKDSVIVNTPKNDYICYDNSGEQLTMVPEIPFELQHFKSHQYGYTSGRFVSEDNNKNLYWLVFNFSDPNKKFIKVTTIAGDVVTFFESPVDSLHLSIDSDGNIFFLKNSGDIVELWRVDRNW